MRDFLDHAAGGGRIGLLNDLVQLPQPEGAHGGTLALGAANGAADKREPEFFGLGHQRRSSGAVGGSVVGGSIVGSDALGAGDSATGAGGDAGGVTGEVTTAGAGVSVTAG